MFIVYSEELGQFQQDNAAPQTSRDLVSVVQFLNKNSLKIYAFFKLEFHISIYLKLKYIVFFSKKQFFIEDRS